MLARTLFTSLRRATPAVLTEPCAVCTCRCGAPLSRRDHGHGYGHGYDNGSRAPQKRWMRASQQRPATGRKAPSTENRQILQERFALTPEEARRRKGMQESATLERWVAKLVAAGGVSVTTDAAMDFLRAFEDLLANARGRPSVDPDRFVKVKDEYGLSGNDCFRLSRLLLQGRQDERFTGRKLLISLSRSGDVKATMYIMANAVQQQRTKPTTLKSVEIQYAKAHLAKVAAEGWNYKAMVLEGRLALALQDEERAIDLWTKAMSAAVEAAEEAERNPDKKQAVWRQDRELDQFQLDSPWIELMMLHYTRSKFKGKDEMSKCQWAMEIGCEQDDPVSHYYASTFTKREDDDGNHVPTSEWLYHITKAATSGHQKAMHELGVFYAEIGWKYIEDEPPDHVKPTPFDSYPAAPSVRGVAVTLRSWAGVHDRKFTKPTDSIFISAAFPNTAHGRWTLALQWLGEACKYLYAPSFLMRAKMHMQETLWPGANMPQSALRLSDERYKCASKEEYDALKAGSRDEVAIDTLESEKEPDPPNPYYNIKDAKSLLRQVFYAHQAHGYVDQAKASYASRRRRGLTSAATDEDDIISEGALSKLPLHIRKWLRFPEVREMYEAEMESLYQEAKRLCDEQQWDIFNDDGSLVYKAEVSRDATRAAASG